MKQRSVAELEGADHREILADSKFHETVLEHVKVETAAKIQIAAAACRTKATSRAGVGELRHETNQVLPTSW